MHNFLRGLSLGVFGLATASYFLKYQLLDVLKDQVTKVTHNDTVSLAVVLSAFAGVLYLVYR